MTYEEAIVILSCVRAGDQSFSLEQITRALVMTGDIELT